MHDMLFTNQGALQSDSLQHFARMLGLNADAFDACLDQSKYAEAVSQHQVAGWAAGLTGSPGVFHQQNQRARPDGGYVHQRRTT
jgi:protein-disulfide isomerase